MGGETARELGKLSGRSASSECLYNVKYVQYKSKDRFRGIEEAITVMLLPPFSSQELNLSYQDLGDPFQQENFLRILRRLIRVEKLQLVDNSLTNLSSVRLPRYEYDIVNPF